MVNEILTIDLSKVKVLRELLREKGFMKDFLNYTWRIVSMNGIVISTFLIPSFIMSYLVGLTLNMMLGFFIPIVAMIVLIYLFSTALIEGIKERDTYKQRISNPPKHVVTFWFGEFIQLLTVLCCLAVLYRMIHFIIIAPTAHSFGWFKYISPSFSRFIKFIQYSLFLTS